VRFIIFELPVFLGCVRVALDDDAPKSPLDDDAPKLIGEAYVARKNDKRR